MLLKPKTAVGETNPQEADPEQGLSCMTTRALTRNLAWSNMEQTLYMLSQGIMILRQLQLSVVANGVQVEVAVAVA
jgi:hypothetical protein